jgi:hypothetical protein
MANVLPRERGGHSDEYHYIAFDDSRMQVDIIMHAYR